MSGEPSDPATRHAHHRSHPRGGFGGGGGTARFLNGVLVGVLFVAVTLGCYQYAWGLYNTKYNFEGRSPAERREAFKTEAAFYYNFFEDVIEQGTMAEAMGKLAAHPAVEAPKTIDAVMRFNIHPEIAIGWLYRQIMNGQALAVGFVDGVVFYTRATMFLFGVDKALLFLAAVLGGGGGLSATFSALTTVLAGFGNINYFSRIWNHPPLREHFGMPFVALQYVGLFLALPVHSRVRRCRNGEGGGSASAVDPHLARFGIGFNLTPTRLLGLAIWFCGVCGLLLCWQLGLFILFGQVTSMLVVCGVYKHQPAVRRRTEQLLATTLVALLVTLYYQHGNPLTLHSLTLSYVAAAVAIVYGVAPHWPAWRRFVTDRMHPVAEAVMLCVASAAVMVVLKKLLQVIIAGGNEGDHIFAVLMTKLGYDEYENLDTVLYNTMAVFNTNWELFDYLLESNLLQLLGLAVAALAVRAVDEMVHATRVAAANSNVGSSDSSDTSSAPAADDDEARTKAAPRGAKRLRAKRLKGAGKASESKSDGAAAVLVGGDHLDHSIAAWLIVTGTGIMWTLITCIMFRFVAVAMPHWQLLLSLAFSELMHSALFDTFSRFFRGIPAKAASGTTGRSQIRRWIGIAHTVVIASAVLSYGQTALDLHESRVGPVADHVMHAQKDLLAAMSWIEMSTPEDAIFSSRMFSAPHIRLIGRRHTTIHPQWEDADIRRRGRLVYAMYSRHSVETVWNLLHQIEVEGQDFGTAPDSRPEHYILLSRRYCKTGTAVGTGLFVDQVTRALKRPEPTNKLAFCEAVLSDEGTPYFEMVFNAKDVFIMRVNPHDPKAEPSKAFKPVDLEARLLAESKAISDPAASSHNEVQAAISSLCSYAEYMIQARAGAPDKMLELLEEAMRLSLRKGRSGDELLPAYKSCFCLYAEQLKRKEGTGSEKMLEYYHLSSVAQVSGFSSAYDRRECLNDVALTLDEELKSPLRALPYYEMGKSLTAGGSAGFLGNFGYAMYLHGNLDFSEELFLESLQKAPRNAHNLCGTAIVLMEKGKKNEAERSRCFDMARRFIEKAHRLEASNQCVEAYYPVVMKQTRLGGV